MSQAEGKLEKTNFDRFIEVWTCLFFAGSLAMVGLYFSELPEKIPIHYSSLSKDKNGFGSKDILWSSTVVFGIFGIGIYKLNQYYRTAIYPKAKKGFISYSSRQTIQMFQTLNLSLGISCFLLTLTSILNGLEVENELNNYVKSFVLFLFVGVSLFYLIKILSKKKHYTSKRGFLNLNTSQHQFNIRISILQS